MHQLKAIRVLLTLLIVGGFISLAHAQTDMVITRGGSIIKGKILENNKDYVRIMGQDSVISSYPHSAVRQIKYDIEQQQAFEEQRDSIRNANAARQAETVQTDNLPGVTQGRNSYSYNLHYYQRKQKVGIGLLSLGGAFCITGTILIATNTSGINSYSNGYGSGINFSPAAAAGVLFNVASVPLIIIGAVQLAKANKHLKAQKFYNSKSTTPVEEMHF